MIVGISKNTEIKDVYTNMIVGISKNTEMKDVYTNMIAGIRTKICIMLKE
jgi:hypothetical protein